MAEQLARFANRCALILLLDVHVERIEVQPERGTAHSPGHFERLVAGIDEVGLKTVERFEANLFA